MGWKKQNVVKNADLYMIYQSRSSCQVTYEILQIIKEGLERKAF